MALILVGLWTLIVAVTFAVLRSELGPASAFRHLEAMAAIFGAFFAPPLGAALAFWMGWQHRAKRRELPLYNVLGMALAIVSALVASHPANAGTAECPIEGFDSEKIEEAVRDAVSCQRSFELFSLCSSTAGGDVAIGAAVRHRCESVFGNRLSSAEQQTYKSAQDQCARKYRHEAGTMYRSFEAFCGAKVALSYADRMARRPMTVRGKPAP